jgi:hypothetical protein
MPDVRLHDDVRLKHEDDGRFRANAPVPKRPPKMILQLKMMQKHKLVALNSAAASVSSQTASSAVRDCRGNGGVCLTQPSNAENACQEVILSNSATEREGFLRPKS